MHQIVSISDLRLAMLFSDYLRSLNIEHRVEQQAEGAVIAVARAEDVQQAVAAFEDFARDPNNPRFRGIGWQNEAQGRGSAPIDNYYRSRSVTLLKQLRQGGTFTLVIAGIALVVYGLMVFGLYNPVMHTLLFFDQASAMWGVSEIWRWLTPVFLHFHPLHIVFNLLWWWILAGMLERFQGVARLAWLFLVLGVGSNLAQFIAVDNRFGGLSGVVYGLLGYWWFYGRLRPGPWELRPAVIGFMLIWLVLGFTGMVGPIANAAHLGGLLIGCLLGVLLGGLDKQRLGQ